MSFTDIFARHTWDEVRSRIYAKTPHDVGSALARRGRRTIDDFAALISPAADQVLEEMAQQSHRVTRQRFGRTVQMYVPLYLSNECQNICTYCGFSLDNPIARVTLNDAQIMGEVVAIKALGFDHVLLVTGETRRVGMTYFKHVLELLRPHFTTISMEVQPLEQAEYEELHELGVHAILVYQESYNRDRYRQWHPKGRKADFLRRLETPDRVGRAGMHKTGIGFLIGLDDWRTEAYFVALHLAYLRKTYWRTKYTISFPRLRPAEGLELADHDFTDRGLVQLICAYRIFDEDVELSLSTRESPTFRDNVLPLGITSMSAGSKTEPGGYSAPDSELSQFEISDERSPEAVAEMLRRKGYEPVWKDWNRCFA